MKIGFIGLGKMGRGMALNLLRSGVDLIVFDQNADAARPLIENGAEPAEQCRQHCVPSQRDIYVATRASSGRRGYLGL